MSKNATILIDIDDLAERVAARVIERIEAVSVADKLLNLTELAKKLGVDPSTIKKWEADPAFPRGLHPNGAAHKRWRQRDIDAWAEGRTRN